MSFSFLSRISIVTSLMVLGACGGGGGETPEPPPVNQLPIADSGIDQEVNFSKQVNLTGEASSDLDGSISSYNWVQISGTSVSLADSDTATPSFTSPRISETLRFELTVTDNEGARGSDTVDITVVNATPSADAGTEQIVNFSESVNLVGTQSNDPDGEIAIYSWIQTSGASVSLSEADTATPGFSAPSIAGVLVFELTVTDDGGATAKSTVNIIVNDPPVAFAGTDRSVLESLDIILSATSSTDSDGTVDFFEWTQLTGPAATLTNEDQSESTLTLPSTDTEVTLTFQLEVTDNNGAINTDTVEITVIPNLPPELAIIFPKANTRFYGQVINVSGTVTREETESVATILVNAGSTVVEAVVNDDGKWLAQNVPLPSEDNNIVISATATDQLGEQDTDANALINTPTLTSTLTTFDPLEPNILYILQDDGISEDRLFSVNLATQQRTLIYEASTNLTGFAQAFDIAYDASRDRVLVLDIGGDSIEAIDTNTGILTTLSSEIVGTGLSFGQPYNITIDSVNDRLLVVDSELDSLISVDLASGNRTELSNNTGIGTGNPLNSLQVVDVNSGGNLAFVYDSSSDTIIEVDLATGNRTTRASNSVGTGSSLALINSFVFDGAFNRLAALQWAWDSVILVDSVNGNRTALSSAATSGIELGNPRQILLDTVNNRYIVDDISQNNSSNDLDALVAIDRDTGERVIILEERVGSGPEIESHSGPAIDFETSTAYIADFSADALFKVDLVTGNRELFSDSSHGVGTNFDGVLDLALDKANNRVFAPNIGSDTILSIDLSTGNRTEVASPSIGTGPLSTNPRAIAYRESNNTLLIIDRDLNALIQLNLSNLERTILSDLNNGSGVDFITPMAIALDPINNRALVTDEGTGATNSNALFAIDLTTGDRTILSSFEVGTGANFNGPKGIKVDPINNVAIVADGSTGMMSIDLLNGDRTVISSKNVGNGEFTNTIQSIELDLDNNLIYGVGTKLEALWAIDRNTGDRVIISK